MTKSFKNDSKTFLYSIFHLNLAYSSIAEKDFPTVIKKCYWPLLCLAEKFPQAISLEASGYTLEIIQQIDPKWIKKLRKLIEDEICEFIGSGYAQIIGTLVPAEVNEKNLLFGNETYNNLLGMIPKIAYVNEQAYGVGLLEHYKKAGYKAIIMEWNNPAHFHPEWNSEMSYYPQIAKDQHNTTLPVIWNNSSAFQRFQRYIHNEIDEKQFFSYIDSRIEDGRYLCLYGSDSEVFDFRPGRFHVEAKLNKAEYKKIYSVFNKFSKDGRYKFVLPTNVLTCKKKGHSFQELSLESSDEPLPVKKQEKYNIGRWGLSGKRTVDINTSCYKIYNSLKHNPDAHRESWKELCYLWGSDFRTHINTDKEKKILSVLTSRVKKSDTHTPTIKLNKIIKKLPFTFRGIEIKKNGTSIIIRSRKIDLALNLKRGLAIENLIFSDISSLPLISTLSQGYYEDNDFNVDLFSGHTTIEIPGSKKITDLYNIRPSFSIYPEENGMVKISGKIPLGESILTKAISIEPEKSTIKLSYSFSPKTPAKCSFRTGYLTFNPKAFDIKSLFYSCNNGGYSNDKFNFGEKALRIDPVSLLVSCRRALGNTNGVLKIGDKKKTISIFTEMKQLAALPMLQYRKMNRTNTFFLRSLFSLQEFDDTTVNDSENSKNTIHFELTITARKSG